VRSRTLLIYSYGCANEQFDHGTNDVDCGDEFQMIEIFEDVQRCADACAIARTNVHGDIIGQRVAAVQRRR
jgi:hypothetical protein